MPAAAKHTEAYANCRFYVQIDGINQGVFTEVSGLNFEMDVIDVVEGGIPMGKHPGGPKPLGNVILKRGLTKGNDLFKWFKDLYVNGNINYKNVSIILFDAKGGELFRVDLYHAFPVKWTLGQLTADGKTTVVESIEFAHEYGRL